MPTISMFFGILVSMFYGDNVQHNTPHIHVRYQGQRLRWQSKTVAFSLVIFPLANFEWYRSGSIFIRTNLWQIGNLLLMAMNHSVLHRFNKEDAIEILLDVISVRTNDDYTLDLVFENGEKRRFDMKPFFDRKPFIKLLNYPLFSKAFVQYGTVVWPGNIDIAPETLWSRSLKVS